MSTILKSIRIRNFKSYKEEELALTNFNIVVGRNASGKTNFIEFFKFMKAVLLEERRPFMPFLEWWNFQNVVWEGREDLPIEAEFGFDIDGEQVAYWLSFSGKGGVSRITGERLEIKGSLLLEREGQLLKIKHDERFIQERKQQLLDGMPKFNEFIKIFTGKRKKIELETLIYQEIGLPTDFRSLLRLVPMSFPSMDSGDISMTIVPSIYRSESPLEKAVVFSKKCEKPAGFPLLVKVVNEISTAFNRITILRHPNMTEIKNPTFPRRGIRLDEDASNLHSVLYLWFLEKSRFPERIETAISQIFPETQMHIKLTQEGKIYLTISEKGIELTPPCISDGFYKILAILTAIETKPSLLAIDEIENSLYIETLQYVLDELKHSGTTIIATTHSPMTVDLVKLQDLLVAEKTSEGTKLRRIKDPKKLKEKLAELKITQSESWLSGGLNQWTQT